MVAPRAGFGAVHVRYVAQAHLAAAFTPGVEGRHIISGHDTDLLAVGRSLLPKFREHYPLPRRQQQEPQGVGHDLSTVAAVDRGHVQPDDRSRLLECQDQMTKPSLRVLAAMLRHLGAACSRSWPLLALMSHSFDTK